MKKLTITLVVMAVVLSLPGLLSAQYFMSQLSDARTIDDDAVVIGGGVSIFENDVLGVGGNVRIGVMEGLEIGGRGGFINFSGGNGEDHTGITIGGDIKYQIMDVAYGDAVDLAIGGGIEYYNYPADITVWMFGANTIVSYPVEFQGGQILSPFFRLNTRLDRASANGNSDTDFNLGFGFGAMFDITKMFGFFGEVNITGGDASGDGFIAGVWFGM